jgi:molybdenum cofactor cytidylyltransferase
MTIAASFAGIILAAGDSSRMGRDKALLPWPPAPEKMTGETRSGETFLSAAIRSLSPATDFVLVVVGKNQAALAPVIYAEGASLVVNEDPSRGQFSSLQVGLQEALNRGRDAAMVTLVDRPPVNPATLQMLRHAFSMAKENIWAVVPEYSDKHGHPYLIGREMITKFLEVPPTSVARDIEHAYQAHIQYVPVDDPLVALNINTPEDYEALAARPQNC